MKRFLCLLSLCFVLIAQPVEAQKNSTSSSSPPSKSYSGGSTTPRPSTPAPSVSKPLSTPSPKQSAPAPSVSKPTTPVTKSYSGGSTPPKVQTPTKSYSGGSSTKPEATPVVQTPPKIDPPKTGSLSLAPKTNSIDQKGQRQQAEVESKKTFQQTKTVTPRTSTQTVSKIDHQEERIKDLKSQLSHERMANRDLRQREVFGNYYSRPIVYYNDPMPINSFFWFWMLDRSLDERAMWAYHHRYDMDSARYNDLLLHDAQLSARIRELESQNLTRNTKYVPTGIDPDLMYEEEYVKQVAKEDSGILGNVCVGIFVVVLFGFVIWFIFIRKV